MASVVFKSRVPSGFGVWEYTYGCTCGNASGKDVKVTASNHTEGRMLAEMACDEQCGEGRSASESNYYNQVASILSREQVDPVFVVAVNEVTRDFHVVTLCTGDEIAVPSSIVKDFRLIGNMQGGGRSNTYARMELDSARPEVVTISQLAAALQRTLKDSSEARDGKSAGEEYAVISIPCSGAACNPTNAYFDCVGDITSAVINRTEGCSAWGLTRIGKRRLRITHDALNGTRCGTGYGGKCYVDISFIR
ncbi:MAG: hypothetical protein IT355_13275 [Gemmatimonadaceae bacterium]|nr:hypothetical protein [Gemmatimonadaceae bacterium]